MNYTNDLELAFNVKGKKSYQNLQKKLINIEVVEMTTQTLMLR